eukprot:3086554-Pyramimonas_sp.AAC.1
MVSRLASARSASTSPTTVANTSAASTVTVTRSYVLFGWPERPDPTVRPSRPPPCDGGGPSNRTSRSARTRSGPEPEP